MTATPTSRELAKAQKPGKRKPSKAERKSALDRATERTRQTMPAGEPTPELYRHHAVEERGSATNMRKAAGKIVRDGRYLDRYWLDGHITKAQYEAGDRLYQTWRAAGLSPQWIGDYGTTVDGGGGESAEEAQQRALNQLQKVKENVTLKQWNVLQAVVIWDAPATEVRRDNSDTFGPLREALTALAKYWKIGC